MIQRNPRVIGGIYQTGQVITSGSVLTQYTAYNRNTGDVVGLYVVELPPALDQAAVSLLLQPLERRRPVQSAHVIHVFDWGIDDTRAYIATDAPRGVTLRHVLDTENIDLRRALELAQQLARGLVALHSQGIADIDMRPQLITIDMLDETDRAQFDDIGLRLILKLLGYPQGQRPEDISYLDPRYASPEQIQQRQTGPWSDIYQLGLLIFELVAGRLPFVGRTPSATEVLQVSAPVPRLAQFTPEAPPALQDLLDRVLSKDPPQRLPGAEALLSALESIARFSTTGVDATNFASLTIPPVSAEGPTNEMTAAAAQDDRALQSTVIDEDSALFQALSERTRSEAEEGVLAYLCYEPEDGQVQRFAINSNYVIVGRRDPKRNIRPEVDLSSIDPRMTVSRQHARIRYEKTFFYIEDLKSHNKTRLGQLTLTPLKAELLRPGDVIYFGSVRMVFRLPVMKEAPVLKEGS